MKLNLLSKLVGHFHAKTALLLLLLLLLSVGKVSSSPVLCGSLLPHSGREPREGEPCHAAHMHHFGLDAIADPLRLRMFPGHEKIQAGKRRLKEPLPDAPQTKGPRHS